MPQKTGRFDHLTLVFERNVQNNSEAIFEQKRCVRFCSKSVKPRRELGGPVVRIADGAGADY